MRVPRLPCLLLPLSVMLPSGGRGQQASTPTIRAQQLVLQTVAQHRELHGLEIAIVTDSGCATVAATAPEDVGERCDADELGPIHTGQPDVESPTRSDPVYDITQALHDRAGHVIGAVGMDLAPAAGATRGAVLKRAQTILRELEAQIESKAALLGPPIPVLTR